MRMNLLSNLFQIFFPKFLKEEPSSETMYRYRRLWTYSVLITSFVAVGPLVTMTVINVYQSEKIFKAEITHPIKNFVSNAKRSLEFNFEERKAALNFVIHEKTFSQLSEKGAFDKKFYNLKQSFGGFVDLGLIDSDGIQRTYSGPYELLGKNYFDQDWFNEVKLRDFYISDVFMGFRGFPHFIIAVKHELDSGGFFILRATIDIEFINRQIRALRFGPTGDAFLINRQGIIQTSSRFYGDILGLCKLDAPGYSSSAEVSEINDYSGQPVILGYAFIEQSPFIFMDVRRHKDLM